MILGTPVVRCMTDRGPNGASVYGATRKTNIVFIKKSLSNCDCVPFMLWVTMIYFILCTVWVVLQTTPGHSKESVTLLRNWKSAACRLQLHLTAHCSCFLFIPLLLWKIKSHMLKKKSPKLHFFNEWSKLTLILVTNACIPSGSFTIISTMCLASIM